MQQLCKRGVMDKLSAMITFLYRPRSSLSGHSDKPTINSPPIHVQNKRSYRCSRNGRRRNINKYRPVEYTCRACTLAVRPIRVDSADGKPFSLSIATTFGHASTSSGKHSFNAWSSREFKCAGVHSSSKLRLLSLLQHIGKAHRFAMLCFLSCT